MHIKFQKPDPRAGTTVQMDSRRGQQLVDAGSAVQVNADGAEVGKTAAPAPAAPAAATTAVVASVVAPAPAPAVAAAKTTRGKR